VFHRLNSIIVALGAETPIYVDEALGGVEESNGDPSGNQSDLPSSSWPIRDLNKFFKPRLGRRESLNGLG